MNQLNNVYSENENSYYDLPREEILNLIPSTTKHLLDVGCGSGTLAAAAKAKYKIDEVVGIEKHEGASKKAALKIDKLICGDIEKVALEFSEKHFNCIICADILEHLVNPESILDKLKTILSDDGVLITSIPNIRHIVPLLKIIFNKFEYESSGILDKTHLRFFTLHTMKKMFDETGFVIQRMECNRSISLKFRVANILTLGLFKPFTVYQYIFVLKKKLN
jgi:2-polyprenyl-3-methyl-5-hydroxy-6-metoxy-1,4-benzoquinol methylase